MKKIRKFTAFLLCVLMVIGCVPAFAGAYDTKIVNAGETYTVRENAEYYSSLENYGTIRVPSGRALYLDGNIKNGNADNVTAKIIVEEDAVLTIGSGAVVENYGKIQRDGDIQQNGTIKHFIKLPDERTITYTNADGTYDKQDHTVTFKYAYLRDSEAVVDGQAVSYTNPDLYTDASGQFVSINEGDKLYILVTAIDGSTNAKSDFIDTSRMILSSGGLITYATDKIDSTRGRFMFNPNDGLQLSVPDEYYKFKNIVRLFKVSLPKNKGYYVEDDNGNTGETLVEYGKNLIFKVVLNPDYSNSEKKIGVYWNDIQIPVDEFGWYEVTGPIYKKSNPDHPLTEEEIATGFFSSDEYAMAASGGVTQSGKITVMGVVSNKADGVLKNIISMFRQVFQVLREIFGELFSAFKKVQKP